MYREPKFTDRGICKPAFLHTLGVHISFAPDLLVIDKEPLGVKKELVPSLQYLREVLPECRIVCGFRDILDGQDEVAHEWERRDTVQALENFFDEIFVYGEKDIFDFSKEYNLSAKLEKRFSTQAM